MWLWGSLYYRVYDLLVSEGVGLSVFGVEGVGGVGSFSVRV